MSVEQNTGKNSDQDQKPKFEEISLEELPWLDPRIREQAMRQQAATGQSLGQIIAEWTGYTD